MGKLDLWLQILNLTSFRRRSYFRLTGQLDLRVKPIQISAFENGHIVFPNTKTMKLFKFQTFFVRFWDIRSPSKPLVSQLLHSHWVWSVRFNHFHDQLVLSSSSDSHVALSCLASISSEPYGQLDDEDDEEKQQSPVLEDGLLRRFEDHEESVYACAWSSADPWTFASLSYDGRLVVNQVPRRVKFKILNLD